MARMNSVGPYHAPENYTPLNHYIFTFHDSMFECLAKSFEILTGHGNPRTILEDVIAVVQQGKTGDNYRLKYWGWRKDS